VEGTTRLARGDAGWDLATPLAHDADDVLVNGLVFTLSRGVEADSRVDDGNHERYGLVAERQIFVELLDVDQRVGALYIGDNAGQGLTFVRRPSDEAVYRARIGGRSRYALSAGDWTDRQVLKFQPAAVIAIDIEHDNQITRLERGEDGWGAEGLDADAIAALPQTLSRLRASRILAPNTVQHFPGSVRLSLDAGPAVAFDFATEGEIGVLRIAPEGPQYQVPAALTQQLAKGREPWIDRTLVRIDAAQISRLTLEEPERTSILRRDARTEAWIAVQPANLDVDSRKAMTVAQTLARLRVLAFAEISPEAAGFPSRLRMGANDTVVEFGDDAPPHEGSQTRYVRSLDRPDRIGVIDARVPLALKSAWSR
jgi:hypothetical protein